MNKTIYDLFSILSCGLNSKKCESINDIDISAIHKLAEKHSIASTLFISLEPYYSQIKNQEYMAKWRLKHKRNTFKMLKFEEEFNAISEYLTSISCWYMPLKGMVVKELYPNPTMRQFADHDILFDKSFSNDLKEFMVRRGYDARVGYGKDDIYTKKPFYNFEMHRLLFNDTGDMKYFNYYKNVKDKLIASEDNPYCLKFTDEDFYIYMVLHEFHHYTGGGTGLRAVADTYVFLNAKNHTLDWNYINNELKTLGASEFEKTLRGLSLKALSPTPNFEFTNDEAQMLEYIVGSGTFGTRNNYIENDLKSKFGEAELTKKNKIQYFLSRIFISKNAIKSNYPWIRKCPALLPLGYLHRIFICGTRGFKRLWNEAVMVWKK